MEINKGTVSENLISALNEIILASSIEGKVYKCNYHHQLLANIRGLDGEFGPEFKDLANKILAKLVFIGRVGNTNDDVTPENINEDFTRFIDNLKTYVES